MARANTISRLRRMELLAVRLKQDAHCTVGDLAHQLGVSERTISRDLSLMRDQGMQIDADRGRGGELLADRLHALADDAGAGFGRLRPQAKDWNEQLARAAVPGREDGTT